MDASQQQAANDKKQDNEKNDEGVQLQKAIEEPENPVSGPAKEHAPLPSPEAISDQIDAKPEIKPADPVENAPEVSKELGEFVSPTPDAEKPDLDKDAKDAGLDHAPNETQPITQTISNKVDLPMQYEDAIQTDKKSSPKSSIKWMAKEIARQWKKIFFLKTTKEE